jgi:hypothetical protein
MKSLVRIRAATTVRDRRRRSSAAPLEALARKRQEVCDPVLLAPELRWRDLAGVETVNQFGVPLRCPFETSVELALFPER